VTFDETMPCTSSIFEHADYGHIGETIFVEEQDHIDWGDPEPSPPAAPVEPASTTSADRPNITSSTTWGPLELELTKPRGYQAIVEGEATSSRNTPRHIQCSHQPQQMIGELHELVTRSRSQ
jgi:hypothetical protein